MLAVKVGLASDVAAKGQASQNYLFNRRLIGHWQIPRKGHTHRTDILIRPFLVRIIQATTKHLSFSIELDMNL